MGIVWLVEKPKLSKNRLFPVISGAVPIRMVASMESLLLLGRLIKDNERPNLIVINDYDFPQPKLDLISQSFGSSSIIVSGTEVSSINSSDLPYKIFQILEKNIVKSDYFINFETMSLVIPDQDSEIPLSYKEAKIIKVLMETEGEALSREILQYSVWGDVKVARSTVDSQISRLRKKLAPTFLVIDNVYGGGYKLNHTSRSTF